MVVLRHLVGRPGYISDPVLDSSKRQIIYAHCVAPTKPLGPQGPQNPFEILTHSEDRRGASVRSILPLGYMTTTLEIHPLRREILCHRGVAVENPGTSEAAAPSWQSKSSATSSGCTPSGMFTAGTGLPSTVICGTPSRSWPRP